MISGKGILYTVLAASSAAVLVGTMLTKRSGGLQRLGNKLQNFMGSMRRDDRMGNSMQRAEFDQASTMGHS